MSKYIPPVLKHTIRVQNIYQLKQVKKAYKETTYGRSGQKRYTEVYFWKQKKLSVKRLKLKKCSRGARSEFYSGIEIKGNLNSERSSSKLKALRLLKEIPESVLEEFNKLKFIQTFTK
eukprot:snap_masked-scaffold_3-processed-gene-1.20-mRNA-1 protein AED:1.00 eAED:1.00 QI:0/0/0/0/1/1/2/0/117